MGLLTHIENGIERKHADEEARKAGLRQFYSKAAWDENVSDDVRNYAQDQYLKLLAPEAKKSATNAFGVIGKIKDAFLGGPKPATAGQPDVASQPASPAPAPKFAQGAADREGVPTVTQSASAEAQPIKQAFLAGPPPVAAAPVSAQASAPKFFDTPAARQRVMDAEKQEYDTWLQRGKDVLGPDASARDLAEYAGSKGQRLPAAPIQARTPVSIHLKDGSETAAMRSKDGRYFTIAGELIDPESIEKESPKPSNARVVAMANDFVNLDSAKSLAANGFPFNDHDGKPIDIEKIPEGMVLQTIRKPDGTTYYSPRNMADKVVTVGNQVIAVNPSQVQQISQGAGTVLGQARVGTSGTGQVPVYNPDTKEFEMFNTQRTTNPNTPGPVRAPGATVVPPATPGGAPRPAVAPPASGGMGNRIPAGQRAGVVTQSLPVQQAAVQITGDPELGIKGLKDFAYLADKPESVKRIGSALNLIFDQMDGATGGAHISADAGPISISTGGIGSVLQNAFGVPQKLAEQKSKIISDVVSKLPPDEQEYINSVMSSFASAVGLRSLSKASASQSSVRSIEREYPTIGAGSGVTNSNSYNDKLKRIYLDLDNAFSNLPRGAIDAKFSRQMDSLHQEMKKLNNGAPAKAPAVKGKAATKLVDDLVNAYAGAGK